MILVEQLPSAVPAPGSLPELLVLTWEERAKTHQRVTTQAGREIGIKLPPGRIMGELGFIDPNNRRTATVESLEDSAVLTITYDRLLELYFQNPEFGYYFLRLTTERLMQNITRLEGSLADTKAQIAAVATPVVAT